MPASEYQYMYLQSTTATHASPWQVDRETSLLYCIKFLQSPSRHLVPNIRSLRTLHMLSATSKEIQQIIDSRSIWLPCVIKLTTLRPTAYSLKDWQEMSATQLREDPSTATEVHSVAPSNRFIDTTRKYYKLVYLVFFAPRGTITSTLPNSTESVAR
ncbi:hypothetical protein BC629DRAFT_1506637 [Irpex lacteus]|nr:hypothetical protein BC629DRAFT_1506637 [Irpex lacteus]